MQPVSSSFDRLFVDDGTRLVKAAELLDGADAVGLDVEMGQRIHRLPGGVSRGEQILALIQLAGNGHSMCVDPRRISDLSPLSRLMLSDTVKVVLGGATDIQLLEDRGLTIHNVVDLAEVAISVFGHKEEGMRALADRALDIHIDKSIRREDWLRRPIDPAMLSYAHRDAELTLRLYRWFLEHHPLAVSEHARTLFHPVLPSDIADWVRKFLTKRVDAERLLKDEGLERERDAAKLVVDIRFARKHELSPGQQRRLVRLSGDLSLSELYDDIVPYARSNSSVFRSAAARAIGKMHDDRARPELERLMNDEIADVRAAAEAALKDLTQEQKAASSQGREPDADGLDPKAKSALKRIGESLPQSSTAVD